MGNMPKTSARLLALLSLLQARRDWPGALLAERLEVSPRTVRRDVDRRVEPHHLVTWGGRWYLVAWDLDRDDWRTFRADRIAPRTPTGPRFTPRELPGGDVAAFVAGRFSGGSGGWPCRGEVILELPAAEVSPFVRDGVVEELGPARCRLVLGSWSWAALASAIGRFDADIEVVGPAELNDAFARLARRYADAGS
jgi:predicted DNA-binding transcriptional regulator YafY